MVDQLLATNVERRETADAVADSYRRCRVAPTWEQAPRLAAYSAALDQEDVAARIYSESISELKRRIRESEPDRSSEPRLSGLAAARISA